jgi:alpha-1,2-mannosyltransferase
MLFSVSKITRTFAPDFSVFYDSAKNMLLGKNIYENSSLFTSINYPPPALLFFIPLTFLPYQIAQGIWIIGSFLFIFPAVWLSIRMYEKQVGLGPFLTISTLVFVSFPFRFTLGMGQTNIVALTLVLAACVLAKEKKSRFLSGLFLFLAFVLKPQTLFFLPIFFLYGYTVPVLGAVIGIAALVVSVGFAFGWQLFSAYGMSIATHLSYSQPEIYYNQGIAALLSRILPPTYIIPGWIFLSLTLLSVAAFTCYRKRFPFTVALAIAFPLMLLVEPLSWQHHYVFVLPTCIVAFKLSKGLVSRKILVLLCYFLIAGNIKNFLPLSSSQMGPLILTHAGIGTFILLCLTSTWYKKGAVA